MNARRQDWRFIPNVVWLEEGLSAGKANYCTTFFISYSYYLKYLKLLQMFRICVIFKTFLLIFWFLSSAFVLLLLWLFTIFHKITKLKFCKISSVLFVAAHSNYSICLINHRMLVFESDVINQTVVFRVHLWILADNDGQ